MFVKLKQYYVKHSTNKFLQFLYALYKIPSNLKKDFDYCKKVKEISKKQTLYDRIHLVFLVQLPQIWVKELEVYLEAARRDDYEVSLVAVPSFINADKKELDQTGVYEQVKPKDNDTYDYLIKNYNNVINAVTEEGEWFDLKRLKPDYIFYPRPYDHTLPSVYQSSQVMRYAKICYVAYGFLTSMINRKGCMHRPFFRNCYIYFAENEYIKKFNIRRMPITHVLGLRKTVNVGYPAFLNIYKGKNETSISWDFARNTKTFRILWTPRWTSNLAAGGTNFFRYKDHLIEYAKARKDISILYRPHPLTFQNFLNTGEMTKDELYDFQTIFEKTKNLNIDTLSEYGATFWETDVLLTDGSSIDVDFFITGKPIIWCRREVKIKGEHNPVGKKLVQGMYCANTWQEVVDYIEKLKMGKDTLKEKRENILEEVFYTDYERIPDNFLEEIKTDWERSRRQGMY